MPLSQLPEPALYVLVGLLVLSRLPVIGLRFVKLAEALHAYRGKRRTK